MDLGLKEGDLAGIFTATYTGGSANYAAVIQSTGFDDASTVSAATAVDNLMSAIFLAALAIIPASRWLMSNFAERTHRETSANDKAQEPRQVTGFSLAAAIAFTLSVVALSDFLVMGLNQWFDSEGFSRLRYVFITLFAVLSATFFPGAMARLHGGQTLGIVLAFVFFAAIAAGADVTKLIGVAPILLLFVIVLLSIHALVVFGLGSVISKLASKVATENNLFALSLPELITASNAAILGATTAPALAMARGWPALATPGILAGVAGYIVGTPLGLAVAALLSP